MLLSTKLPFYIKSYSRKKVKTIKKKQTDLLAFGDFSVVAQTSGRVTQKQLESFRCFIARTLKKEAKVWVCSFPSIPVTKKPDGVRLGTGKGSVKY